MIYWAIEEENHGFIGVAKTREAAIKYLIASQWITEETDFYDENKNKYAPVKEILGDNWQDSLLDQDNDFFEGSFYFDCYELIE